ncbi:response regulator [Tahibacter amnicola]|uniref:histidine kinase n=1 Tax=Tahibacter amnicola TaxID=2976241 RepID=A0ABY6BQ15_9GAMM|nr:response regulator [Tahibacter amnicola]UXI69867.1 response regulator [Tahibacter amnicola]
MFPTTARHVLIVEQDAQAAQEIGRMLTDLDYQATLVATPEAALAAADASGIDLALMDVGIVTATDGIDLARTLSERSGIPTLFLSRRDDEFVLKQAMEVRPLGYLTRPIRAAELRAAIAVLFERYLTDKTVRERHRWFATTLNSIADAVVTIDLPGTVTYMNPAALTLTDLPCLPDQPVHVLDLLPWLAHSIRPSLWTTVLRDGRPVSGAEVELQRGAATVTVSPSISLVIDSNRTLGAVIVLRDVSPQKAEHKQAEMTDRLASLGAMAAGVAHEINNPLSVVMANANFIASYLESPLRLSSTSLDEDDGDDVSLQDVRESLSDLRTATARIDRIISDLRVFARPPRRPAMSAMPYARSNGRYGRRQTRSAIGRSW